MVKKPGYTTLIDGQQISKTDLHFEALGSLDEASAAMAMAKSLGKSTGYKNTLTSLQQDFSFLMGLVAGMQANPQHFEGRLGWIEALIAQLKESIKMPGRFIFAGENQLEASLDVARTAVRRAERITLRFAETTSGFDANALQYLNRASTLLYLLELAAREAEADE